MRFALLVVILLVGCQSGGPKVAGAPSKIVDGDLVASLTQQFWAERERIISGGIQPPPGADQVTDLVCDGTTLTWSYVNLGDYNQDGEAGIADLTSIALHFGHKQDPAFPDLLDEVIDGDKSTEVGVSDITPIALNYLATVARYSIQGANAPDGSFGEVGSISRSAGSGLGRLQFVAELPVTELLFFRIVPVDGGGSLGAPSNVVAGPNARPVITTIYVEPTETYTGQPVTFSAEVSGTEPFFYGWDFAGATNPLSSAETSPTVTITAGVGIYNATLTVANEYGESEFGFPIDVRMPVPPDIVEIIPTSGVAGTQITFQATITGEPAPAYAWDFGGAAIPNISADIFPTVTLSATDDYTVSLTVTNLAGEGSLQLPFVVVPPPQPPVISGVTAPNGIVGTNASFSATVSGDEPLTYAWDFGGGGLPNTSADTDPVITCETVGNFNCHLEVSNAVGTDGYNFFWEVRGGTWNAVSLGAIGRGTAPIIAYGYPAAAYTDGQTTEVKFVRATDPFGDAWGTATTVANWGSGLSAVAVNGHPAIAFYADDALHYIRALDAEGSSWPLTDIVVDSGGWLLLPSLIVVNGNPAVAYYDYANERVKYARAADGDGDTWGSPQVIDDGLGIYGGQPTLAMVNGQPAIAYADYTAGVLQFVRSIDAYGDNWNAPLALDGEGYSPRIATVNGQPAVSYITGSGALKLIRSIDVDGQNWGPSTEVVAAPGGEWVLGKHSLAIIAGRPAIAYAMNTTGTPQERDIRYIRASNTEGTDWSETASQLWPLGGFEPGLASIGGRPMVTFSIPGPGVEPLFVAHLE